MCGQRCNLFNPFLHVIFAEGDLSGGDSFFDRARRFGFAHGKQRNFFWIAPALRRGSADALTQLL